MISTEKFVLGTAQLTRPYGIANRTGPPVRDEAVLLLREADRLGIAAVDTAPSYGDSELVIGDSEVALPVFTKIGSDVDPAESIRESLARLRRQQVEIAFLHNPDALCGDGVGVLESAAALVGESIAALGASIYSTEEFVAAVEDPRIAAVQAPVSVASQRLLDGYTDLASASGVRVYARSIFLQGALLLRPDSLPDHLQPLRPVISALDDEAAYLGVSREALAVAFVRDAPGIEAVIIGCESLAQLEHDLELLGTEQLPSETIDRLRNLAPVEAAVLDPRNWPSR